uniref:Uncharacterized protein n=1 Tax=Cacopsylla melanoneura TaxID=428564 RepID=A0A8D9ASZ2_9HEMI
MEKRSVRREHFRVGVGTAFKIVKKARWFSVNSKTHPIIQEKSLIPNEELLKNINNFFKKHNLKNSDLKKLFFTVLKDSLHIFQRHLYSWQIPLKKKKKKNLNHKKK